MLGLKLKRLEGGIMHFSNIENSAETSVPRIAPKFGSTTQSLLVINCCMYFDRSCIGPANIDVFLRFENFLKKFIASHNN